MKRMYLRYCNIICNLRTNVKNHPLEQWIVPGVCNFLYDGFMKTLIFRLKPGADLRNSIEAMVKQHVIEAGYIVTCVGGLSQATVRMAGAKPGMQDTRTFQDNFEIVSLVGTVSVNGSHLHMSFSDNGGAVFGGHLRTGTIVDPTAEIVIGVEEGIVMRREMDEETGFAELVVGYPEEAIEQQVPPESKVLNLVAKEIPIKDIEEPGIQLLVDRLFRVAYGRQGDVKYPTLVGLAAPQIGVSKRVVIIGVNAAGDGKQPELKEFINPEIIKISDEKEEGREGCFSTSRVCGIVERAKKVTVRAYDRHGKLFEHTFEGFPARVAQHEIDHLNGIRFPDRIADDENLHWVEEE